ncbi:hypothetical protein tinsulaeT_02980 [Thalassotalea insulae]|uniref:Uncharacterized protein n=1 Tax=Thalassotalea insulae TaxID=2056778 RepID=A0ABQ6GLS2_9GAMM|nr:hypothetical protein tinsulaeT_02980 [Thalassotalea insulae]
MVSNKYRQHLLQINRLCIYGFAIIGILLDSTLACIFSLTLWVWLTAFIRYETRVLNYIIQGLKH